MSIYHSPSEICQGQTVYFFVDPVQGVTNYRWVIPSGWTYLGGQGTRYLDVQAPASGGTGGSFALFLSNSCGETATPVTKYVSVSYCFSSFSVYPNPSSTEFTIEPTSSNESTSVDQQTEASEFEYYLYDAQGTLKKNEKAKDGKNARVNVKGMKPGLYHLIIKAGDKSEQHHIQIN